MGAAMSWRQFSNDRTADNASRVVRAAVRVRQLLGAKNEHAIAGAAQSLAITPRKARSMLYGEMFRIAETEYRLLLHRWWSDMDRQAAELRNRAEEIEALAEAERLAAAQLSLPLGDASSCSLPSSRGSVSGDGRRLSGAKTTGQAFGGSAGGERCE